MAKPSREEIEREYLTQDVSIRVACRVLQCSPVTFILAMAEYGLPRKSHAWNRSRRGVLSPLQNGDWLNHELKSKTMAQIAEQLQVNVGTVSYYARRHGITEAGLSKGDSIRQSIKRRFPNGRAGEINPNWRGGRMAYNGYIYIRRPDHPGSHGNYIGEHRLVMEAHLGRYLQPTEIVHHKNGIKDDNRIENLELRTRQTHAREHMATLKGVDVLKAKVAQLQAKIAELEHDHHP